MKEIMAVIRPNMTNATKDALEAAAFNFAGEITGNTRHRLLPKRLITLIAADDQADKIVEVIMKTNHTGTPGDGKIFVMPIFESYQVRNGEGGADAY